jgi:hypothetical protein
MESLRKLINIVEQGRLEAPMEPTYKTDPKTGQMVPDIDTKLNPPVKPSPQIQSPTADNSLPPLDAPMEPTYKTDPKTGKMVPDIDYKLNPQMKPQKSSVPTVRPPSLKMPTVPQSGKGIKKVIESDFSDIVESIISEINQEKPKPGVAEDSLNEIGYSDQLGDLSVPHEKIINGATQDGQISQKPVMKYKQGNTTLFFFADDKDITALVLIADGNKLRAIKNFTNQSGQVFALINYIVNMANLRLIITPDEPLTKEGFNWIAKLVKNPSGLKVTDFDGNSIDIDRLRNEWARSKSVQGSDSGDTGIIISEISQKWKTKLQENESRLMPHIYFDVSTTKHQSVAEGSEKTIWVKPSSNHTLIVVKSSSPDIEAGEEYDEGDLNNYANDFGYEIKDQGVAEGSEEANTSHQHHVVSKLDGNVLASYKTKQEAHKNAHGNPVVSGSLETIGDKQYVREQGAAEGGPFSYGAKKPRQGSVADLAAKKRKEQDKNYKPSEPKDQMVGVAKVTKGVAEARTKHGDDRELYVGIEAYGIKGMKSTPWRKRFKSHEAFEKWLDNTEDDVEVLGTREVNLNDSLTKEGRGEVRHHQIYGDPGENPNMQGNDYTVKNLKYGSRTYYDVPDDQTNLAKKLHMIQDKKGRWFMPNFKNLSSDEVRQLLATADSYFGRGKYFPARSVVDTPWQ